MPLEEISSEVALKNLRRRPAFWPERGKNNRKGLVPWPEIPRTFTFADDEKFFCLGSCFAQHVGIVLSKAGFEVLTERPNPHAPDAAGGANHLIRYNLMAMLNEFRWAIDPEATFPFDVFAKEGDGKWMDPTGHYGWSSHSPEFLRTLREYTLSITKNLAQASVVVMTLGLVEVWYDQKLQLYTNVQPSKSALLAEPDRYVLRVLNHDDIAQGLEDVHALLTRHGRPGFKMLVTTSPVPLQVTYRGQDVLIANTYSKSVQRAALDAFVKKHDNVFYIPSYESVTLANPDFAWKDDLRHVNELTVASIMEHVIRTFAPHRALKPDCMAQLQILSEQWEKVGGANALNNLKSLILQNQQLQAEVERLRTALASKQAA